MDYGRQKSTFEISFIVKFTDWSFHVVVVEFLHLSFYFILFITIVELLLMNNRIRKFLSFYFLKQFHLQSCNIGE